MSELTRRTMLKAVAAGMTVLGWNALEHSWVVADSSHAPPALDHPGVTRLPRLDGVVTTAVDDAANFAGDFGRLIRGTPTAVLHPGSAQDVVEMVRYARSNRLTIAMNGQSGTAGDLESHSNFGQALVPGGIAIDARGLSTIHSIDSNVADVDAGVSWAELTDTAAEVGLTPPMLTDFLHLSIGGTLSVGGIGGTMQRVGAQVDNVRELQVVTGRGRLVRCSPRQRPRLFHAVLGGGGQCGIIVRAKVELRPAPIRALVFNLFYDDLNAFVTDQLVVLRDERFHYQEGQIVRRADDSGWRYMMEAAFYFTPPTIPDRHQLLAGLSDLRSDAVILDQTYLEWAHRVDPAVEALKEAGFWAQPHPWLTAFVPASRTVDYIGEVVAKLQPADIGAGLTTLYPIAANKLARPLLVVPRSEPVVFQLSLLRFPAPGHPDIPGLLTQNRAFYDSAVSFGGKRYIIGAIPDMTRADWRRHYGDAWQFFTTAKDIYDPDRVLTPGQQIFT